MICGYWYIHVMYTINIRTTLRDQLISRDKKRTNMLVRTRRILHIHVYKLTAKK